MSRRTYTISITVNGFLIDEVVIDSHYEKKHPDITDAIILSLVHRLDLGEFDPDVTLH
jgi:hypothetical protein